MHVNSRSHWRRRAALGCACVICLSTLTGCLITGSKYEKIDGRYIGPDTISRIEVGETDEAWLMAVLGEPTNRSTITSGENIWRWEYTKVKRSSGSVFLLFKARDRSESKRNVYVRLDEGVVQDVWSD